LDDIVNEKLNLNNLKIMKSVYKNK